MNIGELVGFLSLEDKGFGEGLAKALDKVGEFGGKIGKGLAVAGGAGAVAFGAGLAGAMDFQDANAKLAAQLGSTPKQAQQLGESAGHLYAGGFGGSMEEVNDAIKGVVNNLGDPEIHGQGLEDASRKALTLASVFNVDVNEATAAAGQLMRTGLAKDATEAFDVVTAGFQAGVDKGGDFLDTLNEYGTQFRKLGIDGTTATGLLSQGLHAGARDADVVADALKEFSIRALEDSDSTRQGFEALGLSATKVAADIGKGGKPASDALQLVLDKLRGMKDPVAQSQAAVALFGTQAEDLGKALFALDPAHATDALGQVGGAADEMGKTLSATASSNLSTFARQVQVAFVDFVGGKALPAVTAFTGWLSANFGPALAAASDIVQNQVIPAVQGMAQWVEANRTPIEVIAGLVTAVFLPALVAMGIQATINGAKVAAAWVMQKVEAIGSALAMSWSVTTTVAGWVAMGAAATVNAAKTVAGWVAAGAGAVAQGAVMVGSMAATAASVVAGWVMMGVQSLIRAAQMAAAWVLAMGPVGWIIAAVVGLVALIIANWDTVVQWTTTAWNAIVGVVTTVVQAVVGFVTDRWNQMLAFFQTVWNAILAVINFVWGLIKAYIMLYVDGIKAVLNWFGQLGSLFSGWFQAAYNGAVGAIQGLLGWLGGLPGRILGALGNIGSWLWNAGSDLISGLWRGIQSMGSWLASQITGFIKSFVPGPVLKFLGIASPSRLFADIGRWIPAGLAQGIDGAASLASDATGRLAATVAGGMSGLSTPGLAGIGMSASVNAVGGTGFGSAGTSPSGALVHIEQFNATPAQSPTDIAHDLAWLGKGGG
ncbi:hypothetical protein GCM10010174_70180 [Kutzneria viridogrisea]|uniref:Phage-related protein n=1 Tax=Kutzneria viridogrisea TaxID=47990 RepID=A0ABR6BAU0_9PSEU|nr:phage-related protein [Kutzneria viridogrisea]